MLGVIRKDFIVNRKTFIIWSVMFLGYSLPLLLGSIFWRNFGAEESMINTLSMLNALIIFLGMAEVCGILVTTDLDKKSRYYFCASPLGIRGFVAAKYYEVFLGLFGAFLYCELWDAALSLATGKIIGHSLLYLCILLMEMTLYSLLIPFFIGFGKYGAHMKTAAILVIILCLAIWGLFGDISFFFQEGSIVSRIREMLFMTDNEKLLKEILSRDYPLLVLMTLFPHVLMLLIYSSYRISSALFRIGAITYEDG